MRVSGLKAFASLLLLIILLSGLLVGCSETVEGDGSEYTDESTEYTDEEDTAESETEEDTDWEEEAVTDTDVQNTQEPSSEEDASDQGGTWLVMLYQDADDETLEEDIFTDLNEAERVGSTDSLTIVAQIDRYAEGFDGDGNWDDTRRYYLTQDDDLESIQSEQVGDLGELNMSDGATLVDFVEWAVSSYPADHYALILSDHGTGWPGGWSDPDPENDPDAETIEGFSDMLYLNEIVDALAKIQSSTGVEKLDLIGMDACLMGSLEVFQALTPFAEYAVASQETEPAMGWAYSAVLESLANDPSLNGRQLAEMIVETYIASDSLIIDDEARSKFVERMYDTTEPMEAVELAEEMGKDVTLTAVDLEKIPAVVDALNEMARIMSDGINQKVIAKARTHAQSFESVFGDDSPSPYIDLGHFAKLVKKGTDSTRLQDSVDVLRSAIEDSIVAEKHGKDKNGATGISIYFPNSELYQAEGSDYQAYQTVASSFVSAALWDEFLAYHYTGAEIVEGTSPEPETEVTAPGASEISIAELELSSDTASTGNPVTIYTTLSGEAIGYVYIFTGYVDSNTGNILIIDIDYIDADTTEEVDGVVYPAWGEEEGDVEIELDWEPIEYYITDGEETVLTLLEPDTYGAELVDTVYTVDGSYTFLSGESCDARLYFSGEGELIQVFGFSGENFSGTPSEIIPQDGETFTAYEQWIEFGENDEENYVYAEAGTLTFGSTLFSWDSIEAYPGDYVVGIIAEDLDGNWYEAYASVTVEE